jgi:5-formyltetrahydrofolate cyclo-ligase
LKLAVVFDEEIVEKIPNDPWDEPVDGIVTPLQTIIFD